MNCPRCCRVLIRSQDTGYCLIHGTVVEPERRAWDFADASPGAQRYAHTERCEGCGSPTYRTRWCTPCADRRRRQVAKGGSVPGSWAELPPDTATPAPAPLRAVRRPSLTALLPG